MHEARQGLAGCSRPRAPRRRCGARPRQRRASSRNPRPVTSIEASGSSAWASKPAETISRSGSKPRTAGSTISSNARTYSSLPDPAGSGTFTVVSFPSPGRPRAGIERPLVQRDVEDARVVPEDVLRAVAVVDVPVEDRHPLEPMLRLRRAGRDRDVVEQAEAHRPVGRRVVARGPDEGEAADAARPRSRRPPRAAPPRSSSRRRACRRPARCRTVDGADAARRARACGSARPARRSPARTRATLRPPRAAPPAAVSTRGDGQSGAGSQARRSRPAPSPGRERLESAGEIAQAPRPGE